MGIVAAIAFGDLCLDGTLRNTIGLFSPHDWVTFTVHEEGRLIAARAAGHPVLTFSSVLPLEGGADVYPGIAAGPFGWRIARLVPEPLRSQLDFWDADNLDQHLLQNPPGAVAYVDNEEDISAAFIDYATRHHLPIIHVEESVTRRHNLPRLAAAP
jgi:hypothetical protein